MILLIGFNEKPAVYRIKKNAINSDDSAFHVIIVRCEEIVVCDYDI